MNVAVVYNDDLSRVIKLRRSPTREKYSKKTILKIAESLSSRGHYVEIFDANMDFFERIKDFVERFGVDECFVFNLSYGIQGEGRYSHVPGILEMLGIPYTGSGPLGHSLALDKVVTKIIFKYHGIPTPDFFVVSKLKDIPHQLRFPLIVKPRMEALSLGLSFVKNRRELKEAVERVLDEFNQDALVEDFVDGREFSVSLIGNKDDLKNFPLSEVLHVEKEIPIQTHEEKLKKPPEKLCPAPIGQDVASRMIELSKKAFKILHLRDYARFDIRMDSRGEIFFLEVNSMASLSPSSSFVCSAKASGLTYEELINRIFEVAVRRYKEDA